MVTSPHLRTAHRHGPDGPELADLLRGRGMRVTQQRELVLGAVRRLGHATAEQVHAAVVDDAPSVNITTVYRTLELLEELGLVTHVHLTHGAHTYHDSSRHVHLVCRNCDRVEDLEQDELVPLAARLQAERGFQMDIAHVAIFGLCAGCA